MQLRSFGSFWMIVTLGVLLAPPAEAESDQRLAEAAMKGDTRGMAALLRQNVDVNAPGADGTPALHWVVRSDDLATADLLIRAGANVKGTNRYGVTPLRLACLNGNAEMIAKLLDAGADANAADPTGETVLMTAARNGNPKALEVLLAHGATVDARDPEYQQTALMWAVRENHAAAARLLLSRGAEVDARTRTGPTPAPRPPGAGGGSHGVGIVRGGVPPRGARATTPGAMTSLLYAARDGRLDIVQALVNAGAAVNQADANGITPLLMAITNDHLDVAKLLLDSGGDPNAADWYGRTPLWAAVEVRNMDVDSKTEENGVDRAAALGFVTLLLERGANPNARIKEVPPIRRWMMPLGSLAWVDFTGQTPFLLASLSGDITVMRLLLSHGADPNIPTFEGTTALMAAAGVNWVIKQTYTESKEMLLEAVKLCLERGADINAVNSMGLSAVHGAANRGSDEILEFLAQHGASLTVKDKEGRTPFAWAEGVFLATNPATAKPSTMALIKKLTEGPAGSAPNAVQKTAQKTE